MHSQTGILARHFCFAGRGEIAAGKRADVTGFALDEIERRPKWQINDAPDGKRGTTWRWTRDSAAVRLTLVNEETTFEVGKPTGQHPGTMIDPAH